MNILEFHSIPSGQLEFPLRWVGMGILKGYVAREA